MNDSLNRIINDSVSGSSELLIKLSRLLGRYLSDVTVLKRLLSESEKHFREFALITDYLGNVRKALSKKDAELIKETVRSPLSRNYIYKEIFINALPRIKNVDRVFTLSNSKTVFEILKLLNDFRKQKLKVFVAESRPKLEGRKLSIRLLSENIKIVFGTDVQMADFIMKCDAVFLGADKLLKDGDIVNKSGSLNAAILADHYSKPVYIFAETAKRSAAFGKEGKNSDEVWKKNKSGLKIINFYFEKVPAGLISEIFTENKPGYGRGKC